MSNTISTTLNEAGNRAVTIANCFSKLISFTKKRVLEWDRICKEVSHIRSFNGSIFVLNRLANLLDLKFFKF